MKLANWLKKYNVTIENVVALNATVAICIASCENACKGNFTLMIWQMFAAICLAMIVYTSNQHAKLRAEVARAYEYKSDYVKSIETYIRAHNDKVNELFKEHGINAEFVVLPMCPAARDWFKPTQDD